MKNYFFLLLSLTILLTSCNDDFGTTTVTYQKATAVYSDLEEIRTTSLIADAKTIVNPGKIFIGDDFILIGEEGSGIHVVNNTDIDNPDITSFLQVPGNREFYVHDNIIYAESFYDVLKIDISNLNNPTIVDRALDVFDIDYTDDSGKVLTGFTFQEVTEEVKENSALANELNGNPYAYFNYLNELIPQSSVPSSFAGSSGNQSGTVNRITYHNEYVYLISNTELNVLSDNGTFAKIKDERISWLGDMETIFPHDDMLFIGSRTAMEIYDLADPVNPRQLSRFSHATSCDPVLPTDKVAYVTLRTAEFSMCPGNMNALLAVDISNPNLPLMMHETEMESPYGMAIDNDRLFVCQGENGLTMFDISEKLNPQMIEMNRDVKAYDVIIHPSNSNLILVAGTNGLSQYYLNVDLSLDHQSTIVY